MTPTVALSPGARIPSGQETRPPETVQAPRLEAAPTKRLADGGRLVKVTAALLGPRFVTANA